jgi:putative phosphoesterase
LISRFSTECNISSDYPAVAYVAEDDGELIVGLVADSHDCLPKIKEAVAKINAEPVELVLHAGDYSAPFVTDWFRALKVKMIGVFGNNDAEKGLLRTRFAQAGHEIRGRFTEVQTGSMRIALTHGDEEDLLKSLTTCGGYDVLAHGHSHKATVSKQGRTLIINPGELCGYLTGECTYAILDTATMETRTVSF